VSCRVIRKYQKKKKKINNTAFSKYHKIQRKMIPPILKVLLRNISERTAAVHKGTEA
jgi:hypothetical protein